MEPPVSSAKSDEKSLRRKSRREAVLIFGCCVVLLAAFVTFDAFEHIASFSRTHEQWELDEFLMVLVVLPIGMAVFSLRRLREARRQLGLRVDAERSVHTMAMHDPLTGLANRRNITQAIGHAIKTAGTHPFVLLLIDIDRFRAINDLQGH